MKDIDQLKREVDSDLRTARDRIAHGKAIRRALVFVPVEPMPRAKVSR